MINHEGTVGIRAGKHLADEAVCMLYLPDEYVVTFHVDAFIGFVYGAECIQNVSGNDLGVDGGIPDVGLHHRRAYGLRVHARLYDDVHGYRPE